MISCVRSGFHNYCAWSLSFPNSVHSERSWHFCHRYRRICNRTSFWRWHPLTLTSYRILGNVAVYTAMHAAEPINVILSLVPLIDIAVHGFHYLGFLVHGVRVRIRPEISRFPDSHFAYFGLRQRSKHLTDSRACWNSNRWDGGRAGWAFAGNSVSIVAFERNSVSAILVPLVSTLEAQYRSYHGGRNCTT